MYEDIIIRYEDIMIMARMSRRAPLRLDCSLKVPAHTTKSQQVTMEIGDSDHGGDDDGYGDGDGDGDAEESKDNFVTASLPPQTLLRFSTPWRALRLRYHSNQFN